MPDDRSPEMDRLRASLEQENARLRAENASLRAAADLLGSIQDGIFALDAAWCFTYLNTPAAANVGYEARSLVGKNIWETFPALRGTRLEGVLRRVMAERSPVAVEVQGVLTQGCYLLSVFPIADGISVLWHDYTVKKRTEEALAQSEAKLRAILDATQESVWLFEDDRVVLANETALARWGSRPGEVLGKRVLELNPPDVGPARLARIREVAQTGRAMEFEDERAGIAFHHCMYPITDEAGVVTGVACFSRDVTEHKRDEARVRAARAEAQGQARRLEAVMDALPVGVAILDEKGGRESENRAFAEVWGGPRPKPRSIADYAAYKAMWVDTGQPVQPEEWASARAVRNGETVVGQLMEIERFDGERRFVLNSAAPIRDPAGNVVGCAVAIQDITELRQAEAALRESDARLRLALAAGGMAAWEWDVDTGALHWNDQHYRMFGLERGVDEPNYDTWASRLHPDDRGPTEQHLSQVLAEGSEIGISYRVIRPDDGVRWVEARGRVVRDATGRARRCFGVTIDVTERVRTEEALREVDRRKNEFLAVLSHELRNPLAPIRTSIHILDHAGASAEQAKHAREVIARQVDHLSRLVDDLLDANRISSGKVRIVKEAVDLNEVARRIAEDLRSIFDEHGVALTLRLCPAALPLHADPARVAQVIGNLLGNAVKFTARGGRVTLCTERDAARAEAVLSVTDTGVGMDQETLARIFQPFVQADATLDRTGGGLGLGLALVKSIVELHGGNVAAASDGPGRGAELVVRLPLGAAPATAAQTPAVPSPPGVRRVLIIEDNVDAADSLRDVLELDGHVVEIANDGPEGIARARAFRPDIVFCDIGLPGMDGYAVVEALRKDPSLGPMRIVALSGYAAEKDIARGKEAGFDAHVAKPPSLREIARLLAE